MLVALATVVLMSGCAGPISRVSELMAPSQVATDRPPAGKSLVCIHRPRSGQGYRLYTGIWDSNRLVADLGNGHSVAYVCEPGRHVFANRSVEAVGVVETKVQADRTYDLWVDTAGAFIASFELKTFAAGDKRSAKRKALIPQWIKENRWVTPSPAAADYERLKGPELQRIVEDFTVGKKRDRLQHLEEADYRK